MQNIHSVQQSVHVSQNGNAAVREGSVVQARVLSSQGSSSYVISVAGQKLAVKSEAVLVPGQTFTARVHVKEGQVQLALVKGSELKGEVFQKFSSQSLAGPSSQAFSNLLSSLGLPSTAEGVHLLQYAQQLGLKLKSPVLYQAQKTGSQFSTREEEAAQVALGLDSRGLASTYYAVDAVFSGMNGSSHGKDSEKSKKDKKDAEITAGSKSALESLIVPDDIRSYFDSLSDASVENDAGALTVFNQISTKSASEELSGSWFLFPFEWDYASYGGVIKVFCSLKEKKLHEIVIDLKNHCHKWCFVLYFRSNSVHTLRFSSDSAHDGFSFADMLRQFVLQHKALENITIEEVDSEILKGFCPEDSQIGFVRGVL